MQGIQEVKGDRKTLGEIGGVTMGTRLELEGESK